MAEEFNAFSENHTWDIVPRTPTMHVVGCKWIFKTNFKSDGSVEPYKAHPVALRNHQQISIDYHETFNPVVTSSTIRLILSITSSCNWHFRRWM